MLPTLENQENPDFSTTFVGVADHFQIQVILYHKTMKNVTPYIIGIDLGSNSVGVSAVQTTGWDTLEDPSDFGILFYGSHIFEEAGSDERGKRTLNNQERRKARLARRTHRRRQWRKHNLYQNFTEFGWLPTDLDELEAFLTKHTHQGQTVQPWHLRRKALDEQITLSEFAKAICHLNRHRGYFSTRDLMANSIPKQFRKSQYIIDEEEQEAQEEDGEKLGEILGGIKDTQTAIAKGQARTYGELMAKEMDAGNFTRHYKKRFSPPTNSKLTAEEKQSKQEQIKAIEPKKLKYRSDRSMIENEFHLLWEKQKQFHPTELTKARKDAIHKIIFDQKDIKGGANRHTCNIYPSHFRSPKASDAFQRNRILKDILENTSTGPKLKKGEERKATWTQEQLDKILPDLENGKDLTIDEITQRLGIKELTVSTGKIKKSGKVLGNITRRILREQTEEKFDNYTPDQQKQIIDILTGNRWPKDAYKGLLKLGIMTEELAAKLALTPLPEGYGAYSTKFLNKIYRKMLEQRLSEKNAELELLEQIRIQREPFQSKEIIENEEISESGLIQIKHLDLRNPIVERSIRRTVWAINQIVYRYGIPEKVRVELPRDLTMSAKDKYDLEKQIDANTKEREEVRKKLIEAKIEPTNANMRKAILWQQTEGFLIYEGIKVGLDRLDDLEIDHAVPRSYLYINDNKNLVLCLKSTNSLKGETFLWEFMGDKFSEFQTRVKSTKGFSKTKIAWLSKSEKPDEEWLASQLASTGYIAREIKKILSQLGVPIEVTNGRITEHLRTQWGLGNLFPDWKGEALKLAGKEPPKDQKKNRSDHRHHAIDALVIALTDVSTVQRISRAYRDREPGTYNIDFRKTCPIKGLRNYVLSKKDEIPVTSYTKLNHTGALNEATAQREDLKSLPESLKSGEPNSSRVANGKLIRYNRKGVASQVYRLGNNHHLTIYRSKERNKKGEFDYTAEMTTMIEVAQRKQIGHKIFNHGVKINDKEYEVAYVLQKGQTYCLDSPDGRIYRVSSLFFDPEKKRVNVRIQHANVATMAQSLFNREIDGYVGIFQWTSFENIARLRRLCRQNIFGELLDK